MTSLPDTLVRFGTELEQAIGREQAIRLRKRHRRLIATLVAAAIVVIVGTASAFTPARELFVDEPFSPQGRVSSRTIDDVHFSFRVPKVSGLDPWEEWENLGPGSRWGRFGSLYLGRSTVGGQRAEAVIFWTGFPEGVQAAPCANLLSRDIGRSTGDLAAAMAKAPGTEVLKGPRLVTVGGRPAWHLVLTVRDDLGCDPGFFFTWLEERGGQFWDKTYVGDKISVWIVDVDGKPLVIEAETRQPESEGWPRATKVTRADVLKVEAEIAKIVGSIRFDS